jgi:hypothetical protein
MSRKRIFSFLGSLLFFIIILFIPQTVWADAVCIGQGGACFQNSCPSGFLHASNFDNDCAVPVAVTRICCLSPCELKNGTCSGSTSCPSTRTRSSDRCAFLGDTCCLPSSGGGSNCNAGTSNNGLGCACGDIGGGNTGCSSSSCVLSNLSSQWPNLSGSLHNTAAGHYGGGVAFPSPYTRMSAIIRPYSGGGYGTIDVYYGTSSFPGGSQRFLGSEGAGNFSGTCGGGGGGSAPPPPPPRYNITGYVWVDRNGDGGSGRDSGEPYYTGSLTVRLYNSSGTQIATTNTNAGTDGPYAFYDNLAGTYSVRITPPSGYISTNGTSRAVTLGPDESGNNFGIVAVYDISGRIFNDVDRDYFRDASESKTWSRAVSFTANTTWRLGGTLSVNSAAGTFSVNNTLAGTKRIRFTGGIPTAEGYINRHPLNSTQPFFDVTVGPGCGYSPLHPNTASRNICNARGDVSNLWFVITNSIPWWQTYGLDVRMDRGLTNIIPAAPIYPPYASVIDNN